MINNIIYKHYYYYYIFIINELSFIFDSFYKQIICLLRYNQNFTNLKCVLIYCITKIFI